MHLDIPGAEGNAAQIHRRYDGKHTAGAHSADEQMPDEQLSRPSYGRRRGALRREGSRSWA